MYSPPVNNHHFCLRLPLLTGRLLLLTINNAIFQIFTRHKPQDIGMICVDEPVHVYMIATQFFTSTIMNGPRHCNNNLLLYVESNSRTIFVCIH